MLTYSKEEYTRITSIVHSWLLQVTNVERVENPGLYERYSERKQKMLRHLRDPDLGSMAFTPLDRLMGSSGAVMTTVNMDINSFLRRNIYSKVSTSSLRLVWWFRARHFLRSCT
jgi:hypothetical protein